MISGGAVAMVTTCPVPFSDMLPTMPGEQISRAELRQLLSRSLLTDAEFNAFCIDYFPEVARRFSSGMERVTKTNFLLQLVEPGEILNALLSNNPTAIPDKSSGSSAHPLLKIDEIFPITGVPEHTYVAPTQAAQLEMSLPIMGEGLLVQGPSGVGKTTAVTKALEQLKIADRVGWLQGNSKADVTQLRAWVESEAPPSGYYVVDNAHYLPRELLAKLLRLIRLLVDQKRRDIKFTLIGINQLQTALAVDVPDVMNRLKTVSLGRQPSRLIEQLIRGGGDKARVTFQQPELLAQAACGSFLAAQRLCRAAITVHNTHQDGDHRITEVTANRRMVEATPQEAIDQAREELKAQFHALLVQFARYDETPPPRGACLKLLWLLARADDGMVLLNEHVDCDPVLQPAFEWLMSSNLSRLYEDVPLLANILHYDRGATVLSVEDLLLIFYLNHLRWPEFGRATGHLVERWDSDRGPIFVPRRRPPASEHPPSYASPVPSTTGTTQPAFVVSRTGSASSFTVLHLSDLHFGTKEQGQLWQSQLVNDVKYELKPHNLVAVVVSGDVASRAEPAEYEAAGRFLLDLASEFNLSPHQLILVPGNHDVSWERSERAYVPVRRKSYKGTLVPGRDIDQGGDYIEVRNDSDYKLRFEAWAKFYAAVRGEIYPLEYAEQATLHHFADQNLLFLGLNSAWQCDHHYTGRASIHDGALVNPLKSIRNNPAFNQALKIAVWHHPVQTGAGDDRIIDGGYLEQLAQTGFRLGLHGHTHTAGIGNYKHDVAVRGRQINMLGAGTFGAPIREWVPGYPLQYQLLRFESDHLIVETRRREEINGSWKPDARWLYDQKDPLPRYRIDL